VLKATFCAPYMMGEYGKMVPTLFSVHALDLHVSFLKMTMGHNSNLVLHEESDFNSLTKMWHKVYRSPFLNHKLLEFIKLVEIVVVQVFSFVEDECTFSIMAFMNTKLWNQLNTRLNLCIKFHN
jgi:hypothetical protein